MDQYIKKERKAKLKAIKKINEYLKYVKSKKNESTK
tara:strand:+ start:249 stop:356 length:108 start_codon:yes stop_codon:yes gene_type:complete